MAKESVVDIKGGLYKYIYDPESKKTTYLGPVGVAPALDEAEFMKLMAFEELDPRVVEVFDKRWEEKIRVADASGSYTQGNRYYVDLSGFRIDAGTYRAKYYEPTRDEFYAYIRSKQRRSSGIIGSGYGTVSVKLVHFSQGGRGYAIVDSEFYIGD
jgi:hypothetical protein